MSTQLANRLMYLRGKCEPHFVFLRDHGGRTAFGDYPYTYIIPTDNGLAAFIKNNKFDIVIVIDTEEAYKAITKANYKGIVINEVHTTTTNIKYLQSIQEHKIDAFLAPSQYIVDRIENEFGYKNKIPCFVTSNCLETNLFQYKEQEVEHDRKIILWVGKLDAHKNWQSFLSIAYSLSKQRDDCEFWMLGGETAKDDVAESLISTAGEYNLLSRFRWIQRIEYDLMPYIYSKVRKSGGLYISTSQNESFGMTIVEALACGCAAIAPKVGAIPEILDGEFENCMYPFMNEETAVEKINKLLDDHSLRRFIEEEGIKRVNQRYTTDLIGKRYYDLLLQLKLQETMN